MPAKAALLYLGAKIRRENYAMDILHINAQCGALAAGANLEFPLYRDAVQPKKTHKDYSTDDIINMFMGEESIPA